MTKQELFVKYHWKQTLILAITVIFIATGQRLLTEQTEQLIKMDKKGQVEGLSTVNKNILTNKKSNLNERLIINYQTNLKRIIKNYFEVRTKFNKPHQSWLWLINKTKQKLQQQKVPTAYKNLHLKILLILDKEKQAIKNSKNEDLEKVNTMWEQLLKQFFWLNS